MSEIKFYGLSELLEAIIEKCEVSKSDLEKAYSMLEEMKDKFVLNFEEELESFMAIKLYSRIGFDF